MIQKKKSHTLAVLSATSALLAMGVSQVYANEQVGEITTSSLNVRSGPSTSKNVIGSVKKGQTVKISSSKNGWYQIKYGSKTGWVSGKYVKLKDFKTDESTSSQNKPSQNKKLVATTGLNVRSGGSTKHKVVGYIKNKEIVEQLGVSSTGWYKVKLSNGIIGYASNKYLKASNSSNNTSNSSTNKDNVTIIENLVATANINLRSGASTSKSIITVISKNQTVGVIEKTNKNWYKVKTSNGKIGYCASSYLKSKKETISSNDKEQNTNNSANNSNTSSNNNISNGNINSNSSNNTNNSNNETNQILISKADLNLRSGPSTSYNIIGVVYKHEEVSLIEKTNSSWYKIKTSSGKVGYCTSSYLKSQQELDSLTNKPQSEQDISHTINVKSYAYYTGTITATGTKPTFGRTIAVDPTIIPYGTRVYIKEFDKVFIAEDCGGGIKGKKIDIYMNTKEDCIKWGVRELTLYVLK